MYKGLPITVRWIELDRGDRWGPGTHRFIGSYLVSAPGPAFGNWQYLHDDVFASYHAASAHALFAAQRVIDTNLEREVGAGVPDRPNGGQPSARQTRVHAQA